MDFIIQLDDHQIHFGEKSNKLILARKDNFDVFLDCITQAANQYVDIYFSNIPIVEEEFYYSTQLDSAQFYDKINDALEGRLATPVLFAMYNADQKFIETMDSIPSDLGINFIAARSEL